MKARVALAGAVVASALLSVSAARACTLDGKATAIANGKRAIRSPAAVRPSSPGATTTSWAPFSFPVRFHERATIRLSEDLAQLRRVITTDDMKRPWRWTFGDGTHANGWTVTHRYAHARTYRITVSAYVPYYQTYLAIDTVRILVTR